MIEEIKQCMGNIERTDENTGRAEFVFPESFKGFQGHFPGNPIVPGVCLVQCALAMASEMSGRKLKARLIKSAKFLATISPDQNVQAECSVVDNVVVASFASGEMRIAAIKVEAIDA